VARKKKEKKARTGGDASGSGGPRQELKKFAKEPETLKKEPKPTAGARKSDVSSGAKCEGKKKKRRGMEMVTGKGPKKAESGVPRARGAVGEKKPNRQGVRERSGGGRLPKPPPERGAPPKGGYSEKKHKTEGEER